MPEEDNVIDKLLEKLSSGGEPNQIFSDPELSELADTMAEYMVSESPDVPLPEGARERMMAAVSQVQQESGPHSGSNSSPQGPAPPVTAFPLWKMMPWAVAACLAIVCGLLIKEMNQLKENLEGLNGTVSELQESLEIREREARRLAAELVSVDIPNSSSVTILDSQTGDGSKAVAVWDPERQEVTLHVFDLPKIDPSLNDYQLWIVDPQYENPVDGGLFQVSESGEVTHTYHSMKKVDKIAAFAVTKEVKGGVEVSDGPHLLLGAQGS